MLRMARREYPRLDLDFETAQFKRHHRSVGTRRKSWPDAWEKWLADSCQKLKGAGSRASPHTPASTAGDRAMAAVESGRRLQKLADEGKLQL
jgi:hypothetical protein